MDIKEKVKSTIKDIENNIVEIKKELNETVDVFDDRGKFIKKEPSCRNRLQKLNSIKYAEEIILDFKKVLEEMKNGE